MSAPVTALQPIKTAPGPSTVTAEQRYWRSFRTQQLTPSPHSSPVTHISYPSSTSSSTSSTPDTFAVTSGSRIRIFSSRTRKLLKTITRFGVEDSAHSGSIRPDSRVVVAGGDSGAVQVFDVNSRAILKTWTEHRQPVWMTKWHPTDPTTLMSTSDDRTVRLWDLSERESTTTFSGHGDYVRAGAFMPGTSSNLLATGSYDQTVRLWDPRAPQNAVMTFKHSAPIETVLPLPSGTTLLAASGAQITVLDLVAARPLEILRSHQKTVTALSLASNATRVVSGSLDGHVKIFETAGWRVVAASKYASPILSLSVIPGTSGGTAEDRHLAVGMQSGLLSLKTRLSGPQKTQERERAREMAALEAGTIDAFDAAKARKARRAGTQGARARNRGVDYDGHGAALVLEGREKLRRRKGAPWDQALRAGRYSKALDLALAAEPPDATAVVTLLVALQHRSALRVALAGRDEIGLVPVVRWLGKHVSDARFVSLVSRAAMLVVEEYAGVMGQSEGVDREITRLHERVREQVAGAQVAETTRGMLGVVMAGG